MRQYISVKAKYCKYCGAPISFLKSKSGRWLIVNVYNLNGDEVTYIDNKCKYPFHKCNKGA